MGQRAQELKYKSGQSYSYLLPHPSLVWAGPTAYERKVDGLMWLRTSISTYEVPWAPPSVQAGCPLAGGKLWSHQSSPHNAVNI